MGAWKRELSYSTGIIDSTVYSFSSAGLKIVLPHFEAIGDTVYIIVLLLVVQHSNLDMMWSTVHY